MSKRRRRVEVVVESLAAGGDGVARDADGRVTFVPRAAPGDRLLVSLVKEKKQFARGVIAKVLEASPLRVEPSCELFKAGTCGGCQWQHIGAQAAREAKEEIARTGLRRAIARGAEVRELVEPCAALGWRRRARFSFWAGDPRVLGFFAPGTKKITDVEQCPQLTRGLNAALAAIREHLLPGLSARGEIHVIAGEEGLCHVTVQGTASPKAIAALAAQPCIAGVLHGTRSTGEVAVALEGGVFVAGHGFAQASKEGNLALRAAVESALGDVGGARVLELYAGAGNFTASLGSAASVVAVESASTPKDVSDHVQWIEADAKDAVESLLAEGDSFDVVLLDPPRSGARDVASLLPDLAPRRIVYVSCDVATLARDLETLAEGGYRTAYTQPIDLMPQTAQLEVVAVLER